MLDHDFDALAPELSFTSRGRTITESDVASFACLTGDSHPQHTDAAWSATSPFGERIAHGMLVLSYAFGLVPFDPERVVALRSVRNAVFKRPVAIGDTIHAIARIDRLTDVDDTAGLVTLRLDVLNQNDRVVARCSVDVLWRRGGAEPARRPAYAEPAQGAAPAEHAEPARHAASAEPGQHGAALAEPARSPAPAEPSPRATQPVSGTQAPARAENGLAARLDEAFEMVGLPI